eukprot:c20565_g1_i1.p1 GENE.c20565_g1_i1~~c20565_g1_i1.p1  ORF type:complete len:564 (-),score=232.40 c20565_g1_i1:58-1749(-)
MERLCCVKCSDPLSVTVSDEAVTVEKLKSALSPLGFSSANDLLGEFQDLTNQTSNIDLFPIEIHCGNEITFILGGNTIAGGFFATGFIFIHITSSTPLSFSTTHFTPYHLDKSQNRDKLKEWLNYIPTGDIVLVSTIVVTGNEEQDEKEQSAVSEFELTAWFDLLKQLGGSGTVVAKEEGFALVGVKGAAPSSAPEQFGTKQNNKNTPFTLSVSAAQLSSTAVSTIVRKLLSIAANETQISLPLCISCVNQLMKGMEAKCDDCVSQIHSHQNLLKEIEQFEKGNQKNSSETNSDSEFQQRDEKSILEEIKLLEADYSLQEKQLNAFRAKSAKISNNFFELEELSKDLSLLESQYWEDLNDLELQTNELLEQRDMIYQDIEICSAHLETLSKTNAFNDAFRIWFNGHFGTINGFRLGILPNVREGKIDWDEINAALGQTVLLIATISELLQYDLKDCILRPRGSASKIILRSDKTELYLWGPPSFFAKSSFDKAMVKLLECVKELSDHLATKDSFEPKYTMEGDKIGGKFSVKFDDEENWTRAMKYLLTNLKWLLAATLNHLKK